MSRSTTHELRIGEGEADPYKSWLGRVLVEPNSRDLLLVSIAGSDLIVAGNERSRSLLARNIEILAGSESHPSHLHLEHYPGHAFLDPDSVPLIVELI
jgi:hypothetical protein